MKKLLIIAVFVLLPTICYAQKEDIGDFDGNTWDKDKGTSIKL